MPQIALVVITVLLLVTAGPPKSTSAQTGAAGDGTSSLRSRIASSPLPFRLVRRGEAERQGNMSGQGGEAQQATGHRDGSSKQQSTSRPSDTSSGERYGKPIALPGANNTSQSDNTGSSSSPPSDSTDSNVTFVVLSSLAIVLGLFFLLVWITRRAFPKSATTLPSDVLEVLGRSPLASRHHLQLLRLGHRVLLVSINGEGAETLAEITDTDEVNHLVSLCRQQQPGSISGSFRQVLDQLGTQPNKVAHPAPRPEATAPQGAVPSAEAESSRQRLQQLRGMA